MFHPLDGRVIIWEPFAFIWFVFMGRSHEFLLDSQSKHRSLHLELYFQRQRQMKARWGIPGSGTSAARTVWCWSPPESREIPGRNFLFQAQGSNMCSAYTLSHVLGYDIPPTILTTNLQVGLLNLFQGAENWGTERWGLVCHLVKGQTVDLNSRVFGS